VEPLWAGKGIGETERFRDIIEITDRFYPLLITEKINNKKMSVPDSSTIVIRELSYEHFFLAMLTW